MLFNKMQSNDPLVIADKTFTSRTYSRG
ncbi:MAG: hypothetical protein ACJAYB_003411, partial [Psychromonas sp.]